jgi:hypothetical protein
LWVVFGFGGLFLFVGGWCGALGGAVGSDLIWDFLLLGEIWEQNFVWVGGGHMFVMDDGKQRCK